MVVRNWDCGHPFTPANTITKGAGRGFQCRQCTPFPCGHPRTPENMESKGIERGVRCKMCRKWYKQRYYVRKKNLTHG